jgi:hypothetical protein
LGRNGWLFSFGSRAEGEVDDAGLNKLVSRDGRSNPFRFDAGYIWTTYQKLVRKLGNTEWSTYLQFRPVNSSGALCAEIVLERREKKLAEKPQSSRKLSQSVLENAKKQRETLIDELFNPGALTRLEWVKLTDPSRMLHRQLFRLNLAGKQLVIAKSQPKCKDSKDIFIAGDHTLAHCEIIYQLEFKVAFESAGSGDCFSMTSLVERMLKHGIVISEPSRSVPFVERPASTFFVKSESDLTIAQLKVVKPFVIESAVNEFPDSTLLEIPSAFLGFQVFVIDPRSAKKTHRVAIKSVGRCVNSIQIIQI